MREQRALADTPLELAQLAQHHTTFAEQSKQLEDSLVGDRIMAIEVWFPFLGRRQQPEPMLRLIVADRHLCKAGGWSRDVRSRRRGTRLRPRHHSNTIGIYGTIPCSAFLPSSAGSALPQASDCETRFYGTIGHMVRI